MYHNVMEQKNLRDKNKQEQDQLQQNQNRAYQQTQHLNRSNKVQSVL